jgi:hypothetical protein
LVTKLEAIKDNKKKGEEIAELCSERVGLQTAFIDKKNACRANIKLLPSASAVLRERALADLQAAYREVDADFKALGVMADRANLLDGAPASRGGGDFNTHRATNSELLGKALGTQQATTAKLKARALPPLLALSQLTSFHRHPVAAHSPPPRTTPVAAGGARYRGCDAGDGQVYCRTA